MPKKPGNVSVRTGLEYRFSRAKSDYIFKVRELAIELVSGTSACNPRRPVSIRDDAIVNFE
jgi:hypothetical protein